VPGEDFTKALGSATVSEGFAFLPALGFPLMC